MSARKDTVSGILAEQDDRVNDYGVRPMLCEMNGLMKCDGGRHVVRFGWHRVGRFTNIRHLHSVNSLFDYFLLFIYFLDLYFCCC